MQLGWDYSHAVFELQLHSGLTRKNRAPNETHLFQPQQPVLITQGMVTANGKRQAKADRAY